MPDRRNRFAPFAAAFLVLSGAAAVARGQTCLDYSTFLHREDVLDVPHIALSIAVDGGFGYVACGDSGLAIVDLANPASPVLRGRVDTPGSAADIAVLGSFAYIADGVAGLQVVDISDPDQPSLRGVFDTPGTANAVAISSSRAYVADHFSGLRILDISNPDAPTALGFFDTPSIARGVTVVGTVAFVADGNTGVIAIEVTDGAAPILLDTEYTGGDARSVVVEGNLAYVAGGFVGLRILDVANAGAMSTVTMLTAAIGATRLACSETRLFVVRESAGLQVLDLTNPIQPVEVGVLQTFGSATDVAVAGDFAYVADGGHGVVAVDVSNPVSPPIAGNSASLTAFAVTAAAGRLFTAAGVAGMQIFDLADPLAPALLGAIDTPGSAQHLEVHGSLAYIADGSQGLLVIEVSNPAAPMPRGSVATDFATAVSVSMPFAYVAASVGMGGVLHIVDVTNPDALIVTGSIAFAKPARDVEVRGSHAFVGNFTAGVQVVDVSNPAAPFLVTTIDTPDYTTTLAIDGNRMIVGDAQYVLVVDITNPLAPVIQSAVESADQIYAFATRDDIVYVANGVAGVQILDVSLPQAPVLLGSLFVPGDLRGVVLDSAAVVYGATRTAGLQIMSAQCTATSGVGEMAPFSLRLAAFPSPGAGSVTLRYALHENASASLRIHDVAGRLVREMFAPRRVVAGDQHLAWDGTDAAGRRVAPGIYFAKLQTARGGAVARMVRLR